ncbi:GNAT family acetyltransferase [Pelagibacterium sp. H642]|uniref:GNAT family acetyltransferase n=1 Tax=Pelagibacterium sp. H642 TaxID=1881069 RepID=UPI0028164C32|nr:GNAT family acetyltransferase [Pelagibacterium sp. H642]WMT92741.1 GNAT family acetyltransferase [Pelagibacterium sp. H642]
MRSIDLIARILFAAASTFLMILATATVAVAAFEVLFTFVYNRQEIGSALLDAIGYTIIGVAVFQVARNFFEEESLSPREMRNTGEARQSTTKFVSTIAVAILLEALVAVFKASRGDLSLMLYPTLLLLGGVALIIGLGVYQRLSTLAEREMGGIQGKAEKTAGSQQTSSTDVHHCG